MITDRTSRILLNCWVMAKIEVAKQTYILARGDNFFLVPQNGAPHFTNNLPIGWHLPQIKFCVTDVGPEATALSAQTKLQHLLERVWPSAANEHSQPIVYDYMRCAEDQTAPTLALIVDLGARDSLPTITSYLEGILSPAPPLCFLPIADFIATDVARGQNQHGVVVGGTQSLIRSMDDEDTSFAFKATNLLFHSAGFDCLQRAFGIPHPHMLRAHKEPASLRIVRNG